MKKEHYYEKLQRFCSLLFFKLYVGDAKGLAFFKAKNPKHQISYHGR